MTNIYFNVILIRNFIASSYQIELISTDSQRENDKTNAIYMLDDFAINF